MTIKLHRCPVMFAKSKGHPCWKVQSALDQAGIDYEVVKPDPQVQADGLHRAQRPAAPAGHRVRGRVDPPRGIHRPRRADP